MLYCVPCSRSTEMCQYSKMSVNANRMSSRFKELHANVLIIIVLTRSKRRSDGKELKIKRFVPINTALRDQISAIEQENLRTQDLNLIWDLVNFPHCNLQIMLPFLKGWEENKNRKWSEDRHICMRTYIYTYACMHVRLCNYVCPCLYMYVCSNESMFV